jgi:hypothetical protein
MLRCLIAMTSLVSAAVAAAPAWTWVDQQGQRHFSDRPVEGATKIELSGGQTFSSAEARVVSQPAREPREEQQPAVREYAVLAVARPASQDTVFNIEGNLETELVIYPPLQAGHQIDVILDGERVAIGARDLSFTVPEVWRGEHTLQAVVSDQEGRELKQSLPVTFVVRQNSALQPQPQRAPQQAIPPPRPGSN